MQCGFSCVWKCSDSDGVCVFSVRVSPGIGNNHMGLRLLTALGLDVLASSIEEQVLNNFALCTSAKAI